MLPILIITVFPYLDPYWFNLFVDDFRICTNCASIVLFWSNQRFHTNLASLIFISYIFWSWSIWSTASWFLILHSWCIHCYQFWTIIVCTSCVSIVPILKQSESLHNFAHYLYLVPTFLLQINLIFLFLIPDFALIVHHQSTMISNNWFFIFYSRWFDLYVHKFRICTSYASIVTNNQSFCTIFASLISKSSFLGPDGFEILAHNFLFCTNCASIVTNFQQPQFSPYLHKLCIHCYRFKNKKTFYTICESIISSSYFFGARLIWSSCN